MISCFVAVVFSAANIVSARLLPLTTNQAVEDRYLKGAHLLFFICLVFCGLGSFFPGPLFRIFHRLKPEWRR